MDFPRSKELRWFRRNPLALLSSTSQAVSEVCVHTFFDDHWNWQPCEGIRGKKKTNMENICSANRHLHGMTKGEKKTVCSVGHYNGYKVIKRWRYFFDPVEDSMGIFQFSCHLLLFLESSSLPLILGVNVDIWKFCHSNNKNANINNRQTIVKWTIDS